MSLDGQLFIYDHVNRLVAFKSGDLNSLRALVLIGGLTDGLMSLPYTCALSEACKSKKVALIQPILRSSYTGFGHCRLSTDAEDLLKLLNYLESANMNQIHLLGHSTGCQDILWLLKSRNVNFVRSVILQGPVSDADYIQHCHADLIQEYNKISCNIEDTEMILPFTLFGAPISAYRFESLAFYGGDDDMFSFKSPIKETILPTHIPVLVVMCGHDQFVPGQINVLDLLDEFDTQYKLYLPDADHFISDVHSQQLFITSILEFINKTN